MSTDNITPEVLNIFNTLINHLQELDKRVKDLESVTNNHADVIDQIIETVDKNTFEEEGPTTLNKR